MIRAGRNRPRGGIRQLARRSGLVVLAGLVALPTSPAPSRPSVFFENPAHWEALALPMGSARDPLLSDTEIVTAYLRALESVLGDGVPNQDPLWEQHGYAVMKTRHRTGTPLIALHMALKRKFSTTLRQTVLRDSQTARARAVWKAAQMQWRSTAGGTVWIGPAWAIGWASAFSLLLVSVLRGIDRTAASLMITFVALTLFAAWLNRAERSFSSNLADAARGIDTDDSRPEAEPLKILARQLDTLVRQAINPNLTPKEMEREILTQLQLLQTWLDVWYAEAGPPSWGWLPRQIRHDWTRPRWLDDRIPLLLLETFADIPPEDARLLRRHA